MTEWLKALIYGLVEGVTEWLPVSSTGHLIVLEQYLPLEIGPGFRSFFLVAIQLGAVLAAVLYFSGFLFSGSMRANAMLFLKIIISCLPAAAVGILFDDWIDAHFYHYTVVSSMLVLFGVILLFADERKDCRHTVEEIGFFDAAVIGIYQLISAVFPGVSRSGATIIGGLRCGLSRKVSAEYTFIMSIPVMLGAGLLKLVKLKEIPTAFEIKVLIIGAFSAFIVSLSVIRALIGFVQRHSFKVFGYYRIVLGALLAFSFVF